MKRSQINKEIEKDLPVIQAMRMVSQNFIMPIFLGEIARGSRSKASGDKTLGASPVTIADVGTMILFHHIFHKFFLNDKVTGEEYIRGFGRKEKKIIEAFDLTARLCTSHKENMRFVGLVEDIISKDKTLPKSAVDGFFPVKGRYRHIDPIDGTLYLDAGLPMFSTQFATIEDGCVTEGFIMRPVQDQLFVRTKNIKSSVIQFAPNGSIKSMKRIRCNKSKIPNLSDMVIVYPHAHTSNPHDAVTAPIMLNGKERKSFEELVARLPPNTFKEVLNADGYSYFHGQLFLGEVQAVSNSGAYSWDHLAASYIAIGGGYAVKLFDGQPYLGPNGQVPIVLNDKGKPMVAKSGGVLYAHPAVCDELNNVLHLNHHPDRASVTGKNSRTILRVSQLAA